MFCVECGKETEELSERGLCQDCFLKKTSLARLPERVDIEVCVHCGSRKRGEVWLQPLRASLKPGDAVDEIAETAAVVREAARDVVDLDKTFRVEGWRARTEPTDAHHKHWATRLELWGRAEKFEARAAVDTVVRVKGATCLRCSRRQGGYFEALVQIRAAERDLSPEEIRHARRVASRLMERIVSDGDAMAFVLKDEEIEGGLDVYFGTTNAGRMVAKQVAQDLGGKTTEHAKIVGQKDGLDLFRITFAVRVPSYRKGDVVVLDDEAWLVQTIGSKTVTLRRPTDAFVRSVERERVEKGTVLDRARAEEAVVVSRTPTELQILDPRTFATITVVRPADLPDDAATVEVVRHEDDLIALPPRRAED